MRPGESGRAVGAFALQLELRRAELVGGEVALREHAEHARHGLRRRRIEPRYFRMRVRRAQQDGIGLARNVDVVDEPPAALQQPRVLEPAHRLTDAEGAHVFLPLPRVLAFLRLAHCEEAKQYGSS